MAHLVVTIVGGGAFVPRLCEALARWEAWGSGRGAPPLELRLTARNLERLRAIAAYAAHRVALRRPDWRVQTCDSLEAALRDAAAIILLVRVGGLAARVRDEELPRQFGFEGDEGLGPGGFSNAWRTVPVLRTLASTIGRQAPAARVLNLMAPLGITTRLLLEEGLEAFGLCELPLVTEEALAGGAGLSGQQIELSYGGLNHLGWFWSDAPIGRALLTRNTQTGLIDPRTLERYHAAPLRYFYELFDREAGSRLGLKRPAGRARTLQQLSDTLVQRFSSTPRIDAPELTERPTPWFDRAVVPALHAMFGGPSWEGYVNVPNGKLLPELPSAWVVETRGTIDSRGIRAHAPGSMPNPVTRFLEAVGEAEDLAYQGAMAGDVRLIERALRRLPLPILSSTAAALARAICSEPPPTLAWRP